MHEIYVYASNSAENSTAVRVDVEVLTEVKEWTSTADALWFRDDGDFNFGWTHAAGLDDPMYPAVTCDWGDDSVDPDRASFDLSAPDETASDGSSKTYNVGHAYSSPGEYLVKCTMSNSVSSQELQHTVSSESFTT